MALFKTSLREAAGILVIVGLAGLTVFFIALRGAEQTLVPEVRNKELTEALLELQAKELYPRIQLRYSQSAQDKGMILEQEPRAGTIVKAGRRIRLVVSQGAVLSTVGDYRGKNIEEVQMDLRTLFASAPQALLFLKEPLMYAYSAESAGTILEQRPEPGTSLSGPTALELVVSRGPEQRAVAAPNLVGLSVADALAKLSGLNLRFRFSLRPAEEGETAETVVYQEPPPSTTMGPGSRLSLIAAAPAEDETGEIYAVFTYTLPENPYPLLVRLEALLPSGERRLLAELNHSGGELTIPYHAPPLSVFILSMLGRELYRAELRPVIDPLSPDQL